MYKNYTITFIDGTNGTTQTDTVRAHHEEDARRRFATLAQRMGHKIVSVKREN